ncbi:cinnamoyl-CoA reductase 1 isoform X1 [Amborella trichopoda]|nr:cinnamoyl-CoA reductase 1 isoform X1 [Amborella trichopoda]|eukprot:XP_020526417.1 cinnamoyl-CoA reductase 1 isoform X1 [Amborella trichopoda]
MYQDDEKNAHLKKLDNASTNLQLFKADLLDYGALSSAISGCQGIFHVASPAPARDVSDPEKEILDPAVKGTLNVLKASKEAGARRVVHVSSILAISMHPNWPQDRVMDETCWSDKDFCLKDEHWYCLSKTLAESSALKYAQKIGLDLISVCPTLVIGPMLQPVVNGSNRVFIQFLKGEIEMIPKNLQTIVDVRDCAEALLLAFEDPKACGRYICVGHSIKKKEVIDIAKRLCPGYNYLKQYIDLCEVPINTERMLQLAWKPRPLEETLVDAIKQFQEAGLLGGT